MKIYKITKPSDPLAIYIGRTKLTLNHIMTIHHSNKINKPSNAFHLWLDDTCEIELIENYTGENATIAKMNYIQDYIKNGFIIKNTDKGSYILEDHKEYSLNKTNANRKKYKDNGKEKEWAKKQNGKKNPAYSTWASSISNKAKKEGLTGKQYREKYNIPDFTGPKTII